MRYCKNRRGYKPLKGQEKIYIHYGSSEYDLNRLWNAVYKKRDESYEYGKKPHGLWASPEKSHLSWRDWCEWEQFMLESLDKSFRFKLSPRARILRINSLKDAYPYIIEEEIRFLFSDSTCINQKLDLRNIYCQYDGMEVIMDNDYINFHNNQIFYTWDVDSLCVWHPGVIIPVK